MLHGFQIWVALPKELEKMEPSFVHIEENEIPHWTENGLSFKLIAGEAFGRKSGVPAYSPLYFIEIKNTKAQKVNIGKDLFGESALYILEGSIKSEDTIFEPKQILVAKESTLCEFEMGENTSVYIFGGEAFPEERFIYWNFVATDKAMIEEAKERWTQQAFPKIAGETEFVPLPAPPKF
jgi:redox-sensitive bicupin YhaK (pirin superfamily)